MAGDRDLKTFYRDSDKPVKKKRPLSVQDKMEGPIEDRVKKAKKYKYTPAKGEQKTIDVTASKKRDPSLVKSALNINEKPNPIKYKAPKIPKEQAPIVDKYSDIERAPSSGEKKSSGWSDMLLGATPALLGILTGNSGVGFEESSKLYGNIYKMRREDELLARKLAGSRAKDDEWRAKSDDKFKKAKDLLDYKKSLEEEDGSEPEFADVMKLRKEYVGLPTSKSTQKVNQSYSRIQGIMSNKPSPAGDMAMVFNFMKMLDPGSVVRESEFRQAGNRRGLSDAVQSWYDLVSSGKIMTRKQRADFLKQARELYKSQQATQEPMKSKYSELSKKYKIPEGDVVVPFEVKQRMTYEEKFIDGMNSKDKNIYLKAINSDSDKAKVIIDHIRGKYGR